MKQIRSALVVVSMFATLTACTVDSYEQAAGPGEPGPATPSTPPATTDPMQAVTPPPGKAIVRVVHASADAPAVDVYARGSDSPLVTGLAYGQTSAWLAVEPGSYEFELRAAPSKATDPIAYKTDALAVGAGVKISAVAAGLLSSKSLEASFRVVPVVEGFGAAQPGSARLRILHAGADAPSVDLDVGNDDPTKPEIASLKRFSDTGAEGAALPSNTELAVGIAAGGARVTAFTTPKLPDGANVLVIATGLLGKLGRERDGFSLLAIGPNGSLGFIKQDPMVYALHAGPDAPRVDAFVGASEIVDDVGFGELARPVQVQPGTYTVDFFGHAAGSARPAGNPAASSSTGPLAAGERYLAVATGFLAGSGASAFRLAGYREGFDLGTGKPQLRAVHSSPDATEVDIGIANATSINPVLFAGLSFTQSSAEGGLGASAGHLPIGVTPAGLNSTFVARFTVPATNEQRAFVLASGALDVQKGQRFRFLVVDTATAPWTVSAVHPH
ncbi:MAG TPA: DUF4397 domain-containing protein [Labilithrix sp.]|nr:DUF4397 domain-containing protein [Labilithrix sp.]